MRRWRAWIPPALAVLAVPVAVLLVLVAADVLRVGGSIAESDVRFQARPTLPGGLWEDIGFLPAATARRAAGVNDDLAYRRAVWLFSRVRPGKVVIASPELEALRAGAETKLIDASRAETDPRRRAQLLNLLGLLALDRYAGDPADRVNIIRGAIDSFQSAVKADPGNEDAKFNLELVLRDFYSASASGNTPDRGRLGGQIAGTGRSGSGY
jgi:hypothetical protein